MARKKTKVRQNTLPAPLKGQQVGRLRSVRPSAKPPARVELTLGSIKLPPGSKVDLVRVRGSRDLDQVRAAVRGSELGRRLEVPHDCDRTNQSQVARGDSTSHPWSSRGDGRITSASTTRRAKWR